jgi:hypothetical protein
LSLGNVSVAAGLPGVVCLPPMAIVLVLHLERADERRLGPLVVQAAKDLHAHRRTRCGGGLPAAAASTIPTERESTTAAPAAGANLGRPVSSKETS